MATHSSILAWENPMDRGAWWATVHQAPLSMGLQKSRPWVPKRVRKVTNQQNVLIVPLEEGST